MSSTGAVRSVADQNRSAVDLVTAEIRRAVLTGALPPGEQFSIRELARQLGVSHIPVREALRRLEGQGLVILTQARSAAVAPLSEADLTAIYRLRLRIEPDLAGRSAALATPTWVRDLGDALEESRHENPDRAWEGHYRFHELLVTPAASSWDIRVLHTLWSAAERYTLVVFDPIVVDDEERDRRYARHRRLFDRAEAGDQAGLEAELTEHLQTNEHEIVHRLGAIHPEHGAEHGDVSERG
jgi:DNA-binding GntR family transcriptional regulator